VTVGALAKCKGADSSALSRNLAIMKRRGWLKINAGADRRTRSVMITECGSATLSKACPLWCEAQVKLQRQFGELRLQNLIRELKQMTFCIEKIE
jgi:DNA-binding MarR family transcriptional regulator